jgi:DNA primase small subunit
VKKLSVDGLKDFNPLRDAVVFGDDPVKVLLPHPFSIKMKDQQFDLAEGEQVVPTFLAVFLVGRRAAEIR